MTNRADMIELARRRANIDKQVANKQQRKKQVMNSHGIYQTIKEIAETQHKSADQVRYVMRHQTPIQINLSPQSYAHGYTQPQIDRCFPGN